MTKLLASVRGPEEAEIALSGGADIIDLKDPAKGALGAVEPAVLEATLHAVAGRRPVSAVAGDLPMTGEVVASEVSRRRAADFVKIGLFPASRDERSAVIEALKPLAPEIRLVAVFFADGDPDFDLLGPLAEAGFHGAMIDTMGKGTGGLLTRLSFSTLAHFVREARALGLMTGLAGSLEAPDIPRLMVLGPDYLGFRGALTAGARNAMVDAGKVAQLRRLMDQGGAAAPAREQATGAAVDCDRVFVRDFVLPLEIGAYGHERGRKQEVRFSVEALIARIAVTGDHIGEVYSYDLIIDAVRALAESGHTDLVETLALELARRVLSDRRVFEVTVTVEKLELGPGAVGVSITRRQGEALS